MAAPDATTPGKPTCKPAKLDFCHSTGRDCVVTSSGANQCRRRACKDSGDCGSFARYCANGYCRQACVSDAHCKDFKNAPYCVGGICRATMCMKDSDCTNKTGQGLGRVCVNLNNNTSACRECKDHTDCTNSPKGSVCNAPTGACVQCTRKSHCAALAGVGTASRGLVCGPNFKCVQRAAYINGSCTGDADCGRVPFGPKQFCLSGKCLECSAVANVSCGTGVNGVQGTCVEGVCVECAAESDCPKRFLSPGGFCNTITNKCVQCAGDDSQCLGTLLPGQATPVCCADGSCGMCKTDAECVGKTGLELVGPYCVRNMCKPAGKGCQDDADCAYTGGCAAEPCKPVCSNGVCSLVKTPP